MKRIVILLLIFLGYFVVTGQNKIITDSKTGKPMLIGVCNREAFSDTSFAWWFNSEYDMYEVDTITLEKLQLPEALSITIVMGTWCSDSRREIPRFYKVLDYLKYETGKITLICVGRDKKSEGNEADNLEIKLVPTIIFYHNGKEIGRIIEVPEESLEKHLVDIISEI